MSSMGSALKVIAVTVGAMILGAVIALFAAAGGGVALRSAGPQ
ncbi:hypothetical protein [Paracoccus sp. M683]|nr:hypothetical protein [Paracoccus sp. M683]